MRHFVRLPYFARVAFPLLPSGHVSVSYSLPTVCSTCSKITYKLTTKANKKEKEKERDREKRVNIKPSDIIYEQVLIFADFKASKCKLKWEKWRKNNQYFQNGEKVHFVLKFFLANWQSNKFKLVLSANLINLRIYLSCTTTN